MKILKVTELLILTFAGGKMGKNEAVSIAERHEISEFCAAGVVAFQGRQTYMEDTFKIIKNINGSDIS